MLGSRRWMVLIALLGGGCGGESTAELIKNLKAPDALTRLKAVRILPERSKDAERIIPALTEALKDEDGEVRKGAALGLGTFGEQAKDAVPALQTSLRDPEFSVRKAAGIALAYIDPSRFTDPSKQRAAGNK